MISLQNVGGENIIASQHDEQNITWPLEDTDLLVLRYSKHSKIKYIYRSRVDKIARSAWEITCMASTRRILVLYVSKFQSRKPNNCWLWKYKFDEKRKSRKNSIFSTMDFPQIWRTRLSRFLNLGFWIFFKFWHSVRFC